MDIKKLKPSSKYLHGKYQVINPQKYIGDIYNIIFRSSWEKRFCYYCDSNPNIIKWSSEPIAIKYWNPIDKKEHEYHVDYYIQVKKTDGSTQDWLLEVKPKSQYSLKEKPVFEGRVTEKRIRAYNEKLKIWITNRAKFEAATRFAEARGYKFGTIDETFQFR